MREWPWINWAVFSGVFMIFLAIVVSLGYFYAIASVCYFYLGLAILILASLFVPACLFRKSHVMHIHHYNVGMIFVIMIAYQNIFLAVCSGVANGWMIEGVTVYAFDPVFKKRTAKVEKDKEQGPPNV